MELPIFTACGLSVKKAEHPGAERCGREWCVEDMGYGIITLFNYVDQDGDQIILRCMTVGTKSSNLTNDSHRCRRTQPVKINLLDMAAVSFKLVVETDGGNKTAEYKPASHCFQKLGWALNEYQESVSNFSFKTAGKFGLPPYVTQVTFGNNTITKTDTSFWQILVKNHNMVTPVGLFNYTVMDSDVVILRLISV
ncbi:unnamed protein product [Boreogadus saida]